MPRSRSRLPIAALAASALALAACGGSSPDAALVQDARGGEPTSIVRARVRAAEGGAFTDAAGRIVVRVPAGALNADANLRVLVERRAPAAGPDQTVASAAFEVRLQNDDVALALSSPMTLEIRATPVVHPQLGELAAVEGSAWRRLPSSFYRPSTATVVSTTSALRGTYAAVHRSLRREQGPQVARGYEVFAYETFGNEGFFDALGLTTVLNDVRPVDAVALGAQVDVARVPPEIVAVMVGDDFAAKLAALEDPATTRALIKAGAVVGVKGFYADPASDRMSEVGITCALCHETVKPLSFELSPGAFVPLPIGPLNADGVTNAKMDAGKILSLTEGAQELGVAGVLAGWGPNRFDVRALNELDDRADNPTDTPPIWNFVDLEAQGYFFGWDGLFAGPNALASQAEAVYDLVMHMNGAFGTAGGNFVPPALRPGAAVPAELLAELARSEAREPGNDLDTARLLDLQSWMRSLASPAPGSFDESKAEAGWRIFTGKGSCTACHSTADLTGPALLNLTGDLAGALSGGVHVPALRGVSRSAPYLHDGRIPDLPAAVEAITGVVSAAFGTEFTAEEKAQLLEYLKSL